jgi:hypothetical protein
MNLMPTSPVNPALSSSFDIKDYVDATNDAASRSRTVTVVLVVACVLVFIGFYNSNQRSWAVDRLRKAYDPADQTIYGTLDLKNNPTLRPDSRFGIDDLTGPLVLADKFVNKKTPLSEYIYARLQPHTQQLITEGIKTNTTTEDFLINLTKDLNILLKDASLYDPGRFETVTLSEEIKKLLEGDPKDRELHQVIHLNRLLLENAYPREIAKRETSPADQFRAQLQQSSVRGYVENVRFVRVPFFGIAFDVNDLGVMGGIGFIIILLLWRHSLSREIKSLKISFREAVNHGHLYHFYQALAVRQVFTVPDMQGEKRNRFLAVSPKAVCLLPVLIYLFGVGYDFASVFYYGLYASKAVAAQLIFELLLLFIISYLSYRCLERQKHIDKIWRRYWKRVRRNRYRRVTVIRLAPDLVEEFGSDEAVNSALRGLRTRS